MLDIKIGKTIGANNHDQYSAIINGVPDTGSDIYDLGDGQGLSIHPRDPRVLSYLTTHTFKEVSSFFSTIHTEYQIDNWEEYISIAITCKDDNDFDTDAPFIIVELRIQNWSEWEKPWSISRLASEFQRQVENTSTDNVHYYQLNEEEVLDGFGICYYSLNSDLNIEQELDIAIGMLSDLLENSYHALLEQLDSNAIHTYFQFPEEFKVASKQYLIYFAQFLADIGISVDTEIKEELNKTLFKVTPKDGKESLDKIYEALNIYLNLTGNSEAMTILASNTDVSSIQLQANVLHLQSQLMLANSTIQQKDAAIEHLKLINFEYSKKSLEDKPKSTNTEPLIKGVISLKDYEGKFGVIHFAEMLRGLKRKLS